MDRLGMVTRDFLKQVHARSVRNATAAAQEFQKEGMTHEQIEEMLFASGFNVDAIHEVMDGLPGQD